MSSLIPTIEEIVLDKGDTGLGFNIRGGTDNYHVLNDPGIFITTVKANGAAAKDGRLQPGDKILEINAMDLREVEHRIAVGHFHNAGSMVTLLVERGAEQRILSQDDPMKDTAGVNSLVPDRVQRDGPLHTRPRGFLRWRWLPITLLVGSSAILFLWYLRRRRQ